MARAVSTWAQTDGISYVNNYGGTVADIGVGISPAGVYADIYGAATGKTLFGGQELSGWERGLGLIPFVSESISVVRGVNKVDNIVDAARPLHEIADEIRTAGHPIAADRRTIAVGQDAQGNLHVGSSNGLDAGQRAAAERLGINQVQSVPGLHAEEELMKAVDNLTAVGTSRRLPCGVGEHNCSGQLLDRGIGVTNPNK